MKITELTAIRIMIYEIRESNPNAVRFVVTPRDVSTVLLYMKTQKYDTLMYLYGHPFLLEIMRIFESAENYEECAEIVKQIEAHNSLYENNITTKYAKNR